MAEESGEPSDGMTQPSREKPPWVRLLWLLSGFLLLLVGSWPWLSTVLPQWGTMLRQWGKILWQWCLGSWQWALFLLLRLSGFLLLLKVVWPWLSTVLPQWGKKLSQKRKAAWRWCKERMGGLPLFVAIAIWVVLAAVLLAVLVKWWGGWPTTSPASGAGVGGDTKASAGTNQNNGAFEAVKSALTAVAGIGGVAYLVIKYRTEQREKDRTVDTKVQDAINQLGSDKASTRIAGVYALTDIADTYRGGYRQRVVDILCGYLRSDRSRQPAWDASGHLVESVASDEAVEFTIIAIMRKHLRKKQKDDDGKIRVRQTVDDDQLWCDCEFDLHEATFHEAVDLKDSTFECVPHFRGTKFERDADFGRATFTRGADFGRATFTRGAYFGEATFTGDAYFGVATFTRDAYADFGGAEFRASATFSGIQDPPSFKFEECKFNKICRGAYEWGTIPIPEDNDGLPAGAVWADFPEEDDKDGGTTSR